MKILCSDLEGTLAPEIWQEIAKEFSIDELLATTRDFPEFDDLMIHRMNVLKQKKIKFSDIKKILNEIEPFEGAASFLQSIKNSYQTVIVSDTFYELSGAVIQKLGNPLLLCHHLIIENDEIVGFKKRQEEPKRNVVKAFKSMNFECFCIGDSYNDIQMIRESDGAFIFAPKEILKANPDIISFTSYKDLKQFLLNE